MTDPELLREHFANDRLAETLGLELLEFAPGYAKVRMPVRPRHFNSARTVHGGAIFTLGDYAFAVASNAHGNLALAINVNISFVKAVTDPDEILTAEAVETSNHPKLVTYRIDITNRAGELVAAFNGTAYRKRESVADFHRRLQAESENA